MSKDPINSAGIIDMLCLSEEQWRKLAEQLDQGDEQLKDKRKQPRLPYRKLAQIAVAIKRHGGEWGKYVVRSRDLSSGGIGFIHGAYIHIGTECRVVLKDRRGQVVCLDGVVRQCKLLSGTVHDIGVQFSKPIDLDDFTSAEVSSALKG